MILHPRAEIGVENLIAIVEYTTLFNIALWIKIVQLRAEIDVEVSKYCSSEHSTLELCFTLHFDTALQSRDRCGTL